MFESRKWGQSMVRVPADRCCYREGVGEVVIVSALAGGQDPREGTSEEQYARPTNQEGCCQQREQPRQRGRIYTYLQWLRYV